MGKNARETGRLSFPVVGVRRKKGREREKRGVAYSRGSEGAARK